MTFQITFPNVRDITPVDHEALSKKIEDLDTQKNSLELRINGLFQKSPKILQTWVKKKQTDGSNFNLDAAPSDFKNYIIHLENKSKVTSEIEYLRKCKKNKKHSEFGHVNGIDSEDPKKFTCLIKENLPSVERRYSDFQTALVNHKLYNVKKILIDFTLLTKNELLICVTKKVSDICNDLDFQANYKAYFNDKKREGILNILNMLMHKTNKLMNLNLNFEHLRKVGGLARQTKSAQRKYSSTLKHNFNGEAKQLKALMELIRNASSNLTNENEDVENLKENITITLQKLQTALIQEVEELSNPLTLTVVSPNTIEPEEFCTNVMEHIQKSLYLESCSSYERFTLLPKIYKRLLNRIRESLNLIKTESERNIALKVMKAMFSPEILLEKTTQHRTFQAKHCSSNSAHGVDEQMDLTLLFMESLTCHGPHDFVNFECAHKIPAPGLFAKRVSVKNSNRDVLPSLARFPNTYWKKSKLERQTYLNENIQKMFDICGEQPELFAYNVLNYLLVLALEESSDTVHNSSFLNQFVDGCSEKFLAPLETMDDSLSIINDEPTFAIERLNNASGKNIETKYYKKLLAKILNELLADVFKQNKYKYASIFKRQVSYTNGTKLAVAKKLNILSRGINEADNLIIAIALLDVFLGVKNAEYKAEMDEMIGDGDFFDALTVLHKTINNGLEVDEKVQNAISVLNKVIEEKIEEIIKAKAFGKSKPNINPSDDANWEFLKVRNNLRQIDRNEKIVENAIDGLQKIIGKLSSLRKTTMVQNMTYDENVDVFNDVFAKLKKR